MATATPARHRPLSCVQCRRKKVKCDRRNPCGPCSVRGEGSSCKALVQFSTLSQADGEERSPVERPRERSRLHDHDKESEDESAYSSRAFLLDRMTRLEQRVQALERGKATGLHQDESEAPHPPTSQMISERERISLMAEDVTMGYRGKRRRVDEALNKVNPMDQRTSDHVADIIYQYLALLPAESVVRRLLSFYFDEVDWFTRALDIPWFHAHLDAFYVDVHANGTDVDTHRILPEWLACFLMTLCLSVHLMDSETLREMRIQNAESLAESMFAGAQQVLWASNFLGDCRLEHLTCVILMGLYQYDKKDQADAHWTLLGSSIKAAQIMGLSDMDDNASSWQEAEIDVVQRAKRIWWTLVWFDWSHAFGHNGRYSVVPSQNNTSLPQVLDEQARSGRSAYDTERTNNTFTIARSRLVTFYREATDTFYASTTRGSLDKHDTVTLDRRLEHVIREVPRLYTDVDFDDVPRSHAYEAFFVQLNIHNRILRLHRHVQMQGKETQEGAARSHGKCLNAALDIASLLECARSKYPVLTRMWIVTLYAIGAGLVLFLEQRRKGRLDDRLERSLVTLIELFEDNQHRSYSARNAARLLRRLRRIDKASQSHATAEGRPNGENVLVEAIESFHRRPSKPNPAHRSRAASEAIDPGLQNLNGDALTWPPHAAIDAQSVLGALDVGSHDADLASSGDFDYILDMWNGAAQL